jgi:hypothetical protein
MKAPGISGLFAPADWLSPLERGAVPSDLSHRLVMPDLFKFSARCYLFFQRELPVELPQPSRPLRNQLKPA